MNFSTILLCAFLLNIDSFACGIAYGMKQIKIMWFSLITISLCPIILCLIAMLSGDLLYKYFQFKNVNIIGAIILFFLAFLIFKEIYNDKKNALNPLAVISEPAIADVDNSKHLNIRESILLGITISIDSFILSFNLAILGANIYYTPLLFGLGAFIMLGVGNISSRLKFIKEISRIFIYIPAIIFIILGIMRLFNI